ncbi:MAG: phosphotransferase [Lachnospiraceae bacterium]|nr:phosphotransferase [Lachnospiraceae bacterium]
MDKRKKPVLVIMAAGMGSRYGGLKQIDPVDSDGHVIIDFSIYDAVRAGFEKAVFIIKKENEADFEEVIGKRIRKYIEVEYAYQELDRLPLGYRVPEGRVKPFGTGHAILCCKGLVDGPFAVINADDYYGVHAFKRIYDYLWEHADDDKYRYAMVGYVLENTLTENGHVARGICETDGDGYLIGIRERTRIEKRGQGAAYTEDEGESWTDIPADSTVSMNMWGFTESILSELETRFPRFLDENLKSNPLKCEFFLPSVVGQLIAEEKARVQVLKSEDRWYGVTYREDKDKVMKAMAELKKRGVYPAGLWEGAVEEVREAVKEQELAGQFQIDGEVVSAASYGSGHINDTYLIKTDMGKKYILQRMNRSIFKDTEALMENVVKVTEYLKKEIVKKGGNPERETLNIIRTIQNDNYYQAPDGECYRMYRFIEGATSYDQVKTPADFYNSAVAFGNFQAMLAGFPANELHETIPDFHDTVKRFAKLKRAVEEDKEKRADKVRSEIDFACAREKDAHVLMDMLKAGELPLRVTHNDTKLNNIMIDDESGKGICVIDLDTVMPGLSVNDFGDSIRFGANTATEDERDVSKVSLDMELFEVYVRGFAEGCRGRLTAKEMEMLPMGAKLMTYECGIRFLTDYLEGDVYFKIHRPGQNLDRCRTQFALVADMERKWEEMQAVVKKYC